MSVLHLRFPAFPHVCGRFAADERGPWAGREKPVPDPSLAATAGEGSGEEETGVIN